MRMKLILALAVAGLAGILGYIGYQQHQAKIAAQREEAARAAYLHEMGKHVRIATIYLGRAVDRMQGGEPLTNQQFADAVAADIKDLEARLVEITANGPLERREMTAAAVAYIESDKLFLRRLEAYHRLDMTVDAGLEQAKRIAAGAPYYSSSTRRQAQGFLDELKDNLKELSNSITELLASIEDVRAQQKAAAKVFPPESLLKPESLDLLEKYLKNRLDEDEGAKDEETEKPDDNAKVGV